MNLQISFKQEGDAHIISLKGRFVGSEAEYFTNEIDTHLGSTENAKVVIDLGELEYIGSQGASALLAFSTKHQIKIAHPLPLVKDTLSLLKFDKFFEIYEEVKEAVTSFTPAK